MSYLKAQAKQWKAAGSFGTIGLELVLCILAGFFGGRWLDGKFGTEPWIAVVGFGIGVAAGVKAIVRGWREMQAISAQEEREQGNPPPLPDPEPELEARSNGRWEDFDRGAAERAEPELDASEASDQDKVEEPAGGRGEGDAERER